ncbi:unnamed protein product [Mytilus edulis]|uniref:Novel STAND NTPase 3 domain-containing protein n=1 Tax=Mytilus edulis TaxID=6550 RepID=A0A8S3VM11_MYTED|nr:unnamed protein product [Mytilus edulis]
MADDTGLIPIQQSIPSDLQDKVTAISDLCSKTADNIDKQTYNTHLKCYKPTKTILNYAAINTNIDKFRRNDKQYDYRVYNAADLSKLFLQTHMAKYTAIDDSCDSSALLGIIINIDKFSPSLRSTAQDARLIIRNPWAHCDFTEWDSIKFLSCFKLMEQIIKDLQLNASVLGDLSKWEKSGISFLSGTPLGLELVNEIREQTRSLAEYAQTVAASADDNFAKIQMELVEMTKTFDDRITYIERELEKKAKDDKLMQDRLLNLEEYNTLLENELQRLDQETIPKHKKRATEHVISKICSSNIAVVTGSSGSGKSFLIHHVALHLHSIDEYEIIPSSFVTAPSDIINYRNENRNQVFVIDDICGKHNVNLQIVQTWKDLTGQVEEIFKDNVIESKNTAVRTDKTKFAKLLISCRLEVFKDKRFQRLCCFTKHEWTYLKKTGMSYLFVHDKIFDIAAVVYGQHFRECIIKFANGSFIGDRYVFESLGTTNNESLIIIPEDTEEYYFERLTMDLSNKNIYSTLHNKQLVFDLFRIKLVQFFEKNIEVTKAIFNQLNESGIVKKIDYNDDSNSSDDEIEELVSSVLTEAILEGFEDIIEFLIKLGCEVNLYDSDGRSPLYTASERGFTNIVKLLLNHHCDVSTESLCMYCPLTVACKHGYTEIVKLLIENEVDVSQRSFLDGTPLANACERGHLDIVVLLLQQGADVNEFDTFCDH